MGFGQKVKTQQKKIKNISNIKTPAGAGN